MQWQFATLAHGLLGGSGAIRTQLATEQSPHLPCGEFYKSRFVTSVSLLPFPHIESLLPWALVWNLPIAEDLITDEYRHLPG